MVKRFIVHFIEDLQMRSHEVNCSNASSAQFICEGLFPKARVLEVKEI